MGIAQVRKEHGVSHQPDRELSPTRSAPARLKMLRIDDNPRSNRSMVATRDIMLVGAVRERLPRSAVEQSHQAAAFARTGPAQFPRFAAVHFVRHLKVYSTVTLLTVRKITGPGRPDD
jgi:hypothetical protein